MDRGRRSANAESALPPPLAFLRPSAADAADQTPSSAEIDVMAQLAYFNSVSSSRSRSLSAPMPPAALGGASWRAFADGAPAAEHAAGPIGAGLADDLRGLQLAPAPVEPENEPANPLAAASASTGTASLPSPVVPVPSAALASAGTGPGPASAGTTMAMDKAAASEAVGAPLPATFLRTICDQLEFYFCDENLLGDLFLLKNMNMDGYVKLELLASFGRVKKLTTDMEQIRKALELSTKLLLSEDEMMVCRKEPLAADQTYHGKLARTAIAYNLPEDASVASLRETFQGCGEISYLRLLKKNTTTGRNAVLKPPIAAGETYAIIEFADDEMAKHAVLTLSDQYNWRTGMQVVLFDGTNCDRLKQKMFPVEGVGMAAGGGAGDSRRRARSTGAIQRPPVHVEAVGEGLDDLREGKVSTGVVYSIRGAGGLITPTRQDSACISFRLIPDEDGNVDIRQGDYVSFTVGKNKKSGRKYASKVRLEFRPPASLTGGGDAMGSSSAAGTSAHKDYFAPSPSRWERSRAQTVGGPAAAQPFRARSSSSGTRPKLNLPSPRLSQSPPAAATPSGLGGLLGAPPGLPLTGANPLYRQALGPDGTRGFGARRAGGGEPELLLTDSHKLPFPAVERRRSRSTGGAMHPF